MTDVGTDQSGDHSLDEWCSLLPAGGADSELAEHSESEIGGDEQHCQRAHVEPRVDALLSLPLLMGHRPESDAFA